MRVTVDDTSMPFGIYAADGSVRVTVVDGSTFTGLYDADGGFNVVSVDATDTPVSIYHSCGALRGVAASSETGVSAPNGAIYMDGLSILSITELTIAWTSSTAVDVGYNTGEIIAGDYLDFQIDKVTTFDSVDLEETSEYLDAGEISGGTFEVVLPTLAEDTWYIRVRVRRGSQVSAWSAYDTYSAAVTWTASTTNPAVVDKAFGSTTHTFTNQDFLTGDAIVMVMQNAGSRTITNVTVGGNAATLVIANGAVHHISIWRCNGVSAGNHDVIVTCDFAFGYVGISTGTLQNANTTAASTAVLDAAGGANQPHTTTSALTVPTNGIGLAALFAGTGNTTWNTGTEETDKEAGGQLISTARFTATATPSVNGHAFQYNAMVAASWGPA